MTYRGGIGGNDLTGPRGPRRRLRASIDRVLSVAAFIITVGHVVWEVAS